MATCSCTLEFLAPLLYLTSFVSSDLSPFLPHFVHHYHAGCVGVRLEQMHIFVDEPHHSTTAAAATRALVLLAGVPTVQLVRRNSSFTWDLARAYINRWIVTLPTDAWVINADADEHFYFPCDMRLRMKASHIFCAEMTDRVGSGGRLAKVAVAPALSVQFPHKCYFRQNIRRSMNVQKVVLMRGRSRSCIPTT